MFTNSLTKLVTKRKKSIGRGPGSGKGMHTVGRGQKGQTARAGYSRKIGFEGGQTPVFRLFPKIHRKASLSRKPKVVRLDLILSRLSEGDRVITPGTVTAFTKAKNFKLVGPISYDNVNLAGLKVDSSIPMSNALKNKLVELGVEFIQPA